MSGFDDRFEHEAQVAALLVDSVVDYAIFVLNSEGFVQTWNPGARRLKGYTAEEITGEHFSRFYPREDRDDGLPDRLLEEAEREGRVEHRGWRVRKDGSRFWASVTITALRDDEDDLVGFAKVTRDLTREHEATEARRRALARERSAAAELKRLDEVRSQMLAQVAHDLSTPISFIASTVEMLADGEVTDADERRDFLERIRRNVEDLSTLSDHLREVARLERGELEIDPQPVAVGEIVDELLVDLQAVHDDDLDSRVTDQTVVHVDRLALRRILTNLIENAAKFSPAGSTVTVHTRADGDTLTIGVSDEGPGIADDLKHRIFEGFWQGPDQPDADSNGMGLGLHIVKHYVELHDGRIWVENNPEVGATFYFTLPRSGPDKSTSTSEQPDTDAQQDVHEDTRPADVPVPDSDADRWLKVGRSAVEAVLEQMQDAALLLAHDPHAGYPIVAVNGSAVSDLGHTRKELVEHPVSDLQPVDVTARFEQQATDAVEQRRTVTYEIQRMSPAGPQAMSVTLSPIFAAGADNRCTHLVMVTHDRTEAFRARQALAETERLADIGHWVWHIEADTVEWSAQLYDIWGVQPGDFEATYDAYLDLVHPDDRDEVSSRIQESYATGEPFEFDHRIVRTDGAVRWIHSTVQTFLDEEGQATRMAGTAQDITERKELDQARRSAERATERQEQALELNDDVMQRLSSAWVALETGQPEAGKSHLEQGLVALRQVISELLAAEEHPDRLIPGGLVRATPSTPDPDRR